MPQDYRAEYSSEMLERVQGRVLIKRQDISHCILALGSLAVPSRLPVLTAELNPILLSARLGLWVHLCAITEERFLFVLSLCEVACLK